MPYMIETQGKKFNVVTRRTGKVHGTFDTMGDAKAQMRALFNSLDDHKEVRRRTTEAAAESTSGEAADDT